MAGYSGTALVRKLGISPGDRVGLAGAPAGFVATLGDLPAGAELVPLDAPVDLAICFATETLDLEERVRAAMRRIPADGAIWAAWPKRASRVQTDIVEGTVRELFLPTGLVDVKVCAIDEVWSGLKLVVRRERRAGWPAPS